MNQRSRIVLGAGMGAYFKDKSSKLNDISNLVFPLSLFIRFKASFSISSRIPSTSLVMCSGIVNLATH